MGLAVATLFIMYGPLLLAYRAGTLGLATKEDALASIFVTVLGLYLMLSITLTYEDIVFRGNLDTTTNIDTPKPIKIPLVVELDQFLSTDTPGTDEIECLEEWGSP